MSHVSVFVDEPDPRHFCWVLHESTEDATVWTEVEASVESYPMWRDAFDGGIAALIRLIHDERIGPARAQAAR